MGGQTKQSRAELIDGRRISEAIRAKVAAGVARLAEREIIPGLAVILVGDDPASEVYVRMKAKACRAVGMLDRTVQLPADVTQDALFRRIDALNDDPDIHGILVQLPLPPQLDPKAVLERIEPEKDVDGFHPLNVGRTFVGDYAQGFPPATPAGVLELLRHSGISTHGKHAVVVGRSLIVGKPLASLFLAPGFNATVTLAHRHTPDLAQLTRLADILVIAVGKAGLIQPEMVKPGAVVVDVGVNRVADDSSPRGYAIVGDVDFEGVSEVASAITPVPGGVGPMTITMLLRNTLEACRRMRLGEYAALVHPTA